jgi:HSP20 family molecular chaperone IbpA
VEADRAEATFKNGVLKLRLPKTEAAKSRSIKIKVD